MSADLTLLQQRKDEIRKHDDCSHSQRIKAQEQELQHAKLTIAELRAECSYWRVVAEGFGQ